MASIDLILSLMDFILVINMHRVESGYHCVFQVLEGMEAKTFRFTHVSMIRIIVISSVLIMALTRVLNLKKVVLLSKSL